MNKTRTLLATLLLTTAPGAAAPAEVQGAEPGPSVRVLVDRAEREKALGLDRQLAGLSLERGRLTISTDATEKNAAADWNITFAWKTDQDPKADPDAGVEADDEDSKNPAQLPAVSASDPERVQPLLAAAAAGLKGMDEAAAATVRPLPVPGTGVDILVEFSAPRTGVPRSRQFRLARRFVGALLESLGMAPPPGAWKPALAGRSLVGIYDAEGVGFRGSDEIERVINDTDVDVIAVAIGPEDIHEGVLDGLAAMVFPGGSGSGIARALEPAGVEKVRRSVADGRGFLGVCAGAYFANSGVPTYTAMLPLNHHRPWRKGKGLVKVELTPEGREIFGEEFAVLETRFNNGPVYDEVNSLVGTNASSHRVLARFQSATTDKEGVTHDVMVGSPAIVSGEFGQGRILAVSPHPESHPELNALLARALTWTIGR
jgi:putative intracellular protease/amidase